MNNYNKLPIITDCKLLILTLDQIRREEIYLDGRHIDNYKRDLYILL